MKYIKRFNEESELSIENILSNLNIKRYEIIDGLVNINGGISLSNMNLKKIPVPFGVVYGYFYCNNNNLITLEGSPEKTVGCFNCDRNKLTTLKYAPIEVGGDFSCKRNKLNTLEGCPEEIGGVLSCENNNLYTLDGISINCRYLDYYGNPIYYLIRTFKTETDYIDSLDYNYLRGDKIIKLRFHEACEEAGVRVPESILGYKYI